MPSPFSAVGREESTFCSLRFALFLEVCLGSLANKSSTTMGPELGFQRVSQTFKLLSGSPARPQCVVNQHDLFLWHLRQFAGPPEIPGQLWPASSLGELSLKLQRFRGDSQIRHLNFSLQR